MHIPVIFEDSDIIVLDKPSGIVVHPFDFSNENTVLDFLQNTYPGIFTIDNPITLQDKRVINLGGLVHKLDRDTSGVLIVAKHQDTFDELKRRFFSHEVTKTYIALVEGIIKENTFVIDAPLGRNKKDYKQTVAPHNPRGPLLPAFTEGKVLDRNENSTLVELTPRTGRTHQLRAHMAYFGHPIVGDVAYGSTHGSDRIMLHAHSLTFTLQGETKTFTSPAPKEFF